MNLRMWIKSAIRPIIWPAYSISILNSAAPSRFWVIGTPVRLHAPNAGVGGSNPRVITKFQMFKQNKQLENESLSQC